MSLILDALRRADAERARGAVPGVLTPQAVPAPDLAPDRSTAPAVAALLVAVAAIGAGGWWWWSRADDAALPPPPPAAAVVPTPAPAPASEPAPAPASEPSPAVSAAPAAQASLSLSRSLSPVRPAPSSAPAVAAGPPPKQAEPVDFIVTPVAPPAALAAPQRPPTAAPAPALTPSTTPAARVPLLQDLPAAIRQQLPQLAVSGASYSANPAYRMVIVNGQVLHEGDAAAPGVVLESIAERQVVLRSQSQRWAVPY